MKILSGDVVEQNVATIHIVAHEHLAHHYHQLPCNKMEMGEAIGVGVLHSLAMALASLPDTCIEFSPDELKFVEGMDIQLTTTETGLKATLVPSAQYQKQLEQEVAQ